MSSVRYFLNPEDAAVAALSLGIFSFFVEFVVPPVGVPAGYGGFAWVVRFADGSLLR